MKHEFKVGDEVAVVGRIGITRGVVASVRRYKVRTKVTLESGSTWADDGSPWESQVWSLDRIEPMTDERRALLRDQARHRACKWAAENWGSMPEDVRQTIGDALINARRSANHPCDTVL